MRHFVDNHILIMMYYSHLSFSHLWCPCLGSNLSFIFNTIIYCPKIKIVYCLVFLALLQILVSVKVQSSRIVLCMPPSLICSLCSVEILYSGINFPDFFFHDLLCVAGFPSSHFVFPGGTFVTAGDFFFSTR